ncbi:hypothetical protein BSNK01_20560 [Bacillaceae bacterium]
MSAYRFPMQRILDLKVKEKEKAQLEYGNALQKWRAEENRLRQLQAQIRALQEERCNRTSRTKISELRDYEGYLHYLEELARQQQRRLKQTERELENRQNALLDKTREVKMWQRWQERWKANWQYQREKKEQAALDETATVRYAVRAITR